MRSELHLGPSSGRFLQQPRLQRFANVAVFSQRTLAKVDVGCKRFFRPFHNFVYSSRGFVQPLCSGSLPHGRDAAKQGASRFAFFHPKHFRVLTGATDLRVPRLGLRMSSLRLKDPKADFPSTAWLPQIDSHF